MISTLSTRKHAKVIKPSQFLFVSRLGQTIVRISWRRRKLFLLIWQRSVLRTDFHNKWRYRLRRQLSRQYVLLHEERPSSRHRIPGPAAETLPNCRSSNAWRDRRRQFRPEAVSLRRLRHDSRTACFHKDSNLFVSTAGRSGRLDSDYAKVRRKLYQHTSCRMIETFVF